MRSLRPFLLSTAMLGAFQGAQAAASEPVLEVSRLCSQHFARVERELGIPKQLVQAIAMGESGRWSDEARTVVPWPWTINAGGQGYYFDTMHEAVTFARRLQLKGVESMDVGCMQVNLKHHPNAFASLTDAFNPASNVAYGGKFLRSNYEDLGNWQEAIAAYHSRGTMRGRQYYAMVRKQWQRALGGPVEYASASDVMFNGKVRDYGGLSPRNRMFSISVKNGETTRSSGDAKAFSRADASVRMKVIQVSSAQPKRSGAEVLVVRPAVASAAPAAASAAPASVESPFVSGGRAAESLVAVNAHTGGAMVKRVSSKQKGPNFIFD